MRIVRFTVDVSAIRQLRHRQPLQPAHVTTAPQQPPPGDPTPPGGGPTMRPNNPGDVEARS